MKKIKAMATEVYSRVVGYYRPVKNWNIGKQQEFKDRVLIDAKQYDNTELSKEERQCDES